MPYINRSDRPALDEALESVLKKIALGRSKGEMNYMITRMVLAWLRQQGQSYDSLSNVKAVLDDVRREFHDRYMRPYEDKKRAENGDVL